MLTLKLIWTAQSDFKCAEKTAHVGEEKLKRKSFVVPILCRAELKLMCSPVILFLNAFSFSQITAAAFLTYEGLYLFVWIATQFSR